MRSVSVFFLWWTTSMIMAQAGNPDNSFSSDGKLIVAMGNGADEAYDVAVQPDGKILVVGFATVSGQRDMAILRLNSDGTTDNTFQNSGKLTIDVDGENDEARQITLLPNGDMLIAGTALLNGAKEFIVLRLDSNGELVTSFADGGMKTINVGTGDDILYAMQISQNKIYLAGSSGVSAMEDIAIAVLDMNGDEVNSFNGDGHMTFEVEPGPDIATDLVVQPDGKIVLTGYTLPGFEKDMFIARILPGGEPDPDFDQDGIFIPNVGTSNDRGHAIALQPDGKMMVAGFTLTSENDDFVLLRLLPNGELDDTFGDDGIVIEEIGPFYDEGFAMVLQPDGKILVAGQAAQAATDADFGVARFTADGNPDNTFSGDGKVITPIGNGESEDEAFAVALQPDGKLVVAGVAEGVSNLDFAIARYHTGLTTRVASDFVSVREVYVVPNPVVSDLVLDMIVTERVKISSQLLSVDGRPASPVIHHGVWETGLHHVPMIIPDTCSDGHYFIKLMDENGAVMMVPFVRVK